MKCEHCGTEIASNSKFCSICGKEQTAIKTTNVLCTRCGKPVDPAAQYCGKCGHTLNAPVGRSQVDNLRNIALEGGKAEKSYIWSAISAILSFIIRITTQGYQYYVESLVKNRKVLGIDADLKPFLTVIPVVALIAVLLTVVSDKKTDTSRKLTILVINGVLIALSLLFIWFDIPYKLINY